MTLSKLLVVALVVCASCSTAVADLQTNAWQSTTPYPDASSFPEAELLKDRPNTAIAFTGGGSRAFVAAFGILSALHDLDLMSKVRYIGGISGGAWATTSYSYAQGVNDDEFLCDIAEPQDLTLDNLKVMPDTCARRLAAPDLTVTAVKAWKDKIVDGLAEAWCYGVSETYLEPLGIKRGTRFSMDSDMVADIKSRNPSLADEEFTVLANKNRAFPVIGATLVGPWAGAPYKPDDQNYTMIEFTPMYVGQMMTQDVDYRYTVKSHTKRVGGAIEPFAFAFAGAAASAGLSDGTASAALSVPEPSKILDLQFAAGAASYAPGALVESVHFVDELGLSMDYWSPATATPEASERTLFADGGSYENIPLISFLQRRVSKIALFFLSVLPIQPSQNYNPYTDPYTGDMVTTDLACFFGVFETDEAKWADRSYEYQNNQVFAKDDYALVISSLQQKQAEGGGIAATFNLTTVENAWWGIPAGLTFEITFWCLGRLPTWEAQLIDEVYAALVPAQGAEDYSVTVPKGDFKHFPHYATAGGGIQSNRANALADLTGWSVRNNADVFRHILS